MNTIDYIYRFDPHNPSVKPLPEDGEEAKARLESGNELFSRWMESCRTSTFSKGEPRYVVQCNGLEVGMVRQEGKMPKQAPFACVIGCSDARVPTEMVFAQGFNDLFVIRVAGNVLGDECLGSVGFAINALSESVKVIVMLGHSRCGAVTAAVDAYLSPMKFWAKSTPPMLRSIMQRLFVAVREAAGGLKEVWGANARDMFGYREALIDSAVCLNAAQTAYDLRLEVERVGKFDIEVLYGVYNLFTHHVVAPIDVHDMETTTRLAYAMTNPREFATLSLFLAQRLMHTVGPKSTEASTVKAAAEAAAAAAEAAKGNGHAGRRTKRSKASRRTAE
jgi:carbonic anhydrase